MAGIRVSTVKRRIREILDLSEEAWKIREDSERKFGWVTEKTERTAARLEARAEKIEAETIVRCHEAGYCGEEGFTSAEAGHPRFDGIGDLFVLGDGSWC